ncbi:hypothetical protein GCM10009836_46360 [Pseudonocardia ailaonensis]|uniref:Rhamnogalacturonase A/B/Epimerase-like pectate lyase domain-containing protein n=1 Tax=Pseudonocardia ailaonensis TaxID=367279 RepID=A0ABN2NAU3_9PSEU
MSGTVSRRYAVVAGVVAAAVMAGAGMLATSVTGLVVGGVPLPLWWPVGVLRGESDLGDAVTAVALAAVGGVAGLLGARRTWPGVLLLAAVGGVLAWRISSWQPGQADWPVAALATVVGCVSLFVFLDRGRGRATPKNPAPAGDRRGIGRRALLGIGLLVAAGTGVTGVLARSLAGAAPGPSVTPSAPTGSAALTRLPVVDVVRDHGAVGDGSAGDDARIRAALDALGRTGGTLYFPAGNYRIDGAPLSPRSGVTLAGDPGRSFLDLGSGVGGGFATLLAVAGNDIVVDGITLRRNGSFDAVLVGLGAFTNLTLSRSMLVGNMDVYPDTTCHGIRVGDQERSSGLQITDSVITTTVYGLLQTNESTAATSDITVERCTFALNRNTALEFNSPNGTTSGVRVVGSTFSGTESPDGFGVGLAHVDRAVIEGNGFSGYALEAVHVEDYSTGTVVRGNTFRECGLRDHSHVQIISGSADVLVTDNDFDASVNTERIFVVDALAGGTATTPGGRAPATPSTVRVEGNRFLCGAPVLPVLFEGVAGGRITDNRITAAAVTAPQDVFRIYDDRGTVITGNTLNGVGF